MDLLIIYYTLNKKNKWFSTMFLSFSRKKSRKWKHSSVYDPLEPGRICWNPLGPVETRWNTLESVRTRWNPLGPVGTRWDTLGHVGTCLMEVIFLTQYNNNNNNNILWIRKINAFQMCFSVSTNTKTEKPL